MRASQLHKLNVRGETSDFQFAPFVKSVVQNGTDVIPATIEVTGFGNIGDVLNVTTDIGGGSVAHSYTVLAAQEDLEVMATGLAADITLEADHTAVAVANVVQVTKTTAGTVQIVSVSIS
jgi:hypothetical protein